jgi:hypothetical protein
MPASMPAYSRLQTLTEVRLGHLVNRLGAGPAERQPPRLQSRHLRQRVPQLGHDLLGRVPGTLTAHADGCRLTLDLRTP